MGQQTNEIYGFKCFNKGLTTRYGDKLEIGKIYESNGAPIFQHNGFHMCERMEDTLRYFDAFGGDVDICRVIGYPPFHDYYDDYYGYYDMHSCQKIILTELLTRDEIIKEADKMNELRFRRFLSLYHLNDEELKMFVNKYKNNQYVLSHLIFYYFDNNVYKKISEGESYEKLADKYIKRLVKKK